MVENKKITSAATEVENCNCKECGKVTKGPNYCTYCGKPLSK